jgi:hypothetical protein
LEAIRTTNTRASELSLSLCPAVALKPARAFPSAPSTGKETAASDAEDLVVRQEAPHSLKTSQHAVNARNIGRAW